MKENKAMGHCAIGISGFSGSGKTTLIEKLIPIFKSRGSRVAVIKHDAHDFDMDREGKDTCRFSKAGADCVMISSDARSALISESPRALLRMIDDAYDRGVDLIFIEGYKYEDIPKIFVMTKRSGYTISADIKGCEAVATDDMEKAEAAVKSLGKDSAKIALLDIDDAAGIASWIEEKTATGLPYKEYNKTSRGLTHFDDKGNAWMVDVSDKDMTVRTAIAAGRVIVNRETLELIKSGGIKKGDVLTVAQTAGIMGAKRTPDLIPMCHPIITDGTSVRLKINEEECCIDIEAQVKCTGRTGVEMEAICACSVAAMTVYDMCKSSQRDMLITDIKLMSKTGGSHGDYVRKC